MSQYLLGIDIGGSTIKIGCFDLEGNLLEKWYLSTESKNQGAFILPEIAAFLLEHFSPSDIQAIGFGVPGPVKAGVASACVNLGWKNVDVRKTFLDLLGNPDIRIEVANDASAAAFGEYHYGAGRGYENIVLLTIGTGIGGGVIINGKLLEGKDGMAGEFGHIVVDFKRNLPCNCGKNGCLETIASATGIVNLAKIRLESSLEDSILRTYPSLNAKRVFDSAKNGDALAIDTIQEAARGLAYMFLILTLSFNPDVFILGGGVANAGDFFLEKIRKHYDDFVRPLVTEMDFRLAILGNDAGMYGAVSMVK